MRCRQVVSALPGGDTKIRSQQAKILNRLEELEGVRQIKHELQRTHIADDAEPTPMVIEDDGVAVFKPEPELMGSSPRTKRRLMERLEVRPIPRSAHLGNSS